MKARPYLITAFAIGAMSLHALAVDAKNYSYNTSAKTQSADEMEDLGEISPSGDAGSESDGKSMSPPEAIKGKFRVNVSARGEYTSNAKLSGDHSSSDFIGLPTVEGGYNVALGKHFTFDLAAKVESGLYADNQDRGFAGYSANATLDYRPKTGLPRIYVSAEPYRYDSFDTGDRITQAVGVSTGTDWGISFNAGRSVAFVGYNYGHYFADPSIDNRNSHRVVVGLAHQLRQNLTGQLFYAWQYNDYTDIERHDSRNLVGVNFVCAITKNLFGSFTTSFVDNDSSFDRASYQSVTASLGLTLQF
ncbi:MAG: outer membrane beta-barrel protein [Chthoniobacteraceae bacterium]